jgi:hypothetical protein
MTYAELVKHFADKKIVSVDHLNQRVTLGSGEVISTEEYDRRWVIQDRADMEWNQKTLDLYNGLGGPVDIPTVIGSIE